MAETAKQPGGACPEGIVQQLIFKSGEWFFLVNAVVMGCVLLAMILGGTHLVISDIIGGRTICAGGIMIVLAGLAILNAEWEGDWQYPESEDEDNEREQGNAEDDAEFETFLEQLAGEFPWIADQAAGPEFLEQLEELEHVAGLEATEDNSRQPAPKRNNSDKRRKAANQAVVADLMGNNSHAAPAAAAGRDPLQDRLLRLRERLKTMEGAEADPRAGEPDEEPERDSEFDRLLQRIGEISTRLGMAGADGVSRLPSVTEGPSEPDAEPPSEQTLRSSLEYNEASSNLRRRHAAEPSPGQQTG